MSMPSTSAKSCGRLRPAPIGTRISSSSVRSKASAGGWEMPWRSSTRPGLCRVSFRSAIESTSKLWSGSENSLNLFKEFSDPLHSLLVDSIALRKLTLQRPGRVDDRHGISQPPAEALDLTDELDILVPMGAGRNRPHDFALVEGIDIVVDNHAEFQIGHLDKGLHRRLVGIILELLADRDVAD